MSGFNFIRKWVVKQLTKKADEGIMVVLPKKNKVDLNTNITAERLMSNGINPNSIKSVEQVDNIINQLNKPRVIDATSSEGKKITKDLFGKKGEVFDLTGKKIDTSKPILGGKNVPETDVVADTIATIKSKSPIDAMKEANSVIARKGKYKNLTPEESKKILKDTEDHIFERDIKYDEFGDPIKPDPEDLADGGVAGLLGERTGFANGRWADPGMSPGTRADYSPGQGHRDTPSKRLRKNLTNRIFHETRQPGFETATSKKKQEKQQQDIRDLQKQMADVSWDANAQDYVTQHTANEFQKQTAPRLPRIPKPPSDLPPFLPPLERRRPPWFLPEFQKRRYLYQKEEDLPEGILELLKKDPNFDLETFLNIGWSMPENVWDKGAEGLRGIYYNKEGPTGIDVPVQPRGEPPGEKIWDPEDIEGFMKKTYRTPSGGPTERIWDPEKLDDPVSRTFSEGFFGPSVEGQIDLQMRPFKEDDSPMIRNPNEPTSYTDEHRMSNMDKARVALHEMRHKKYVENPVLWKSQPEWVQNVEMPGTLESEQFGGKYLAGHELYNRFLDQRYFPPTRDIDDPHGEPYFDKILKDLWEPSAKKYDQIINEYDLSPVNLADGGIAGMLGEPAYADGGRTGFKGKKFDPKRRTVLKGIAALATLPVIGKYFKWAKPLAKTAKVADLTSVPIKAGVDGMPAWFKPLVNKVIKEGDDVSKRFATGERQIVHQSTLPNSKTPVTVTQDLTSGNVTVDVGMGKHGWSAGHHGQPVRLDYRASEDIMTGPDADDLWKTGRKKEPHVKTQTKTKEEFWVEEAEFTGGHPENIKFEESISEKFGSHGSNFDEVEKFATGKIKKKTGKASIKAERAHWTPEGDYATGGRVPLRGGKWVLEGLMSFLKKKPKKLETLKDFIDRRQLLKNLVGNTPENEKARILADLKKAAEEARKNPPFKFPDAGPGSDIHKEIEMILSKGITKHADGGVAGMLGE